MARSPRSILALLERNGDATTRVLALAACLAVILGAKLWLIAVYGSSTPFWDQWSEPVTVYRPYLTGQLKLSELLAAHNEHRIFLARLIQLAVFAAEGRWDSIVQTVINAAVHTAAIGLVFHLLSRSLTLADTLLLALLTALIFALPFGWGNTLVGFQIAFYLLILLAPASLWILCSSTAWTPRWWFGTFLGIASYFTIASGALTLPAFMAIAALQLAFGIRRGSAEWLGLLVHAVIAAVIILDIPRLPPAAGSPTTAGQWLDIAVASMSWPISKPSWHPTLRALTVIAMYAPVIVLAQRLLARAVLPDDPRWVIVAIAGWVMLQFAVLLYGRGIVLQLRYYDILLLGPLASGAALLSLRSSAEGGWRTTGFACVWFLAIVIGIVQKARDDIPPDLAWWRDTDAARTANFTRFLATNDFSALANKPEFHIPYPSAEVLRDIASDPLVRGILPPELTNPGQVVRKNFALRQGPVLLPIGLGMFMMAGLLASRRRNCAGGT